MTKGNFCHGLWLWMTKQKFSWLPHGYGQLVKKMFLVDNGYREPKKILSHRMVISNQKKFSQ